MNDCPCDICRPEGFDDYVVDPRPVYGPPTLIQSTLDKIVQHSIDKFQKAFFETHLNSLLFGSAMLNIKHSDFDGGTHIARPIIYGDRE